LIHRDIKPANIIVVADRGGAADVAKVVDFGLVRDLDEAAEVSKDDIIRGTPDYLSPEAISTPDKVDGRGDLYALAAVGYLLLTGRVVFEGRTVMEVCGHHLHSKPVPPADRLGRPLPEKLSTLILECLEKDPNLRPASAADFLVRLSECDDVAPWTEDQARAWWKKNGAVATAIDREPSSGARTAAGTLSVVRPAGSAWRPYTHRKGRHCCVASRRVVSSAMHGSGRPWKAERLALSPQVACLRGRKNSPISAASSSGSSVAAKWPPEGISVQRMTL